MKMPKWILVAAAMTSASVWATGRTVPAARPLGR